MPVVAFEERGGCHAKIGNFKHARPFCPEKELLAEFNNILSGVTVGSCKKLISRKGEQ